MQSWQSSFLGLGAIPRELSAFELNVFCGDPKQTMRKNGVDRLIQHTLSTLRHQLFAHPGVITYEGRRPLLKLATAMQKREWISGLWEQSKLFDLPVPFSSQFAPCDTS